MFIPARLYCSQSVSLGSWRGISYTSPFAYIVARQSTFLYQQEYANVDAASSVGRYIAFEQVWHMVGLQLVHKYPPAGRTNELLTRIQTV